MGPGSFNGDGVIPDDGCQDDEFFGEQSGPHAERLERERELAKLRRLHLATGFRDHADDARGQHLQRGFDHGFLAGARAASPAAFWCVESFWILVARLLFALPCRALLSHVGV